MFKIPPSAGTRSLKVLATEESWVSWSRRSLVSLRGRGDAETLERMAKNRVTNVSVAFILERLGGREVKMPGKDVQPHFKSLHRSKPRRKKHLFHPSNLLRC